MMFNNKTKIFCVLSVLFIMILAAGLVSATDTDGTSIEKQTASSDTSTKIVSTGIAQKTVNNIETTQKENKEKKIIKSQKVNSTAKKASQIELTQENFDTYFKDGVYSDDASDILLSGEFNGKEFVFASQVSITSKDVNTKVYNSSFNFFTGADGSSLTNVYIEDKNYTDSAILLNEVNNIKIQNNTIIQHNDEGETHAITMDISDNNNISYNNITVTGMEYQVMYDDDYMPITSLSAIHAHQINYNRITNNNITTRATKYNGNEVSTTVGFDLYSNPMSAWMGDDPDSSENNEISDNTVTTEGIKYAYSFRLNNNMNNNTIKNNKITSTSFYAYGIEYAYGDYAKILENNIVCNGNLSYGIIYTTNGMGDINNGLIENNTILVNDADVAYLIEFYGGARSFNSVINNNTLTATGGQVVGIAGALSNRLNITNNKITITGNSTRTLKGLSEQILPELTGLKISESSDKVLISENMLNITDLSDGDINSLNLKIKNSTVLNNEIHVSSYVNSRSLNITGTDNTVEGNYPFTPEPIILKMDSLATEKSLPTKVYLTATDNKSRTFTHGTVIFKLNNEEIGTSTITNGKAAITFTLELDVGTYTIEATYLDDDWFVENSTNCTLEVLDPYYGVYYVSPTGSDTNEGSQNSPKKTVKNAVDMASKEGKNKNIIILDGTYVENNIEINVPLNITGEGNVVIDANHEGLIFSIKANDTEIKNIKFINGINKNGGAINTTGTLTLENVTFECNNATSYGGAVYSEGNLVVSDSKFINNTGDTGGGAIYDVKGTVTITDSEFTGQYSGGGGAVYSKFMTTIDNSVFTDNRARTGGSLYISGNGTVTDTNFTASSSDNSGAVLYQSDIRSSVNLTNVNVKDCVSNTSLFHYNNLESVLDNVNITDSTSAEYLIYLARGNLTVTDSNIKDNNCSKSAICSYYRSGSTISVLTVENSEITNNSALNIFESRGKMELEDNIINDNVASSDYFKVNGNGEYTLNGNTLDDVLFINYPEANLINEPITIDVEIKLPSKSNINDNKIYVQYGDVREEYDLTAGKVSFEFTPTSTSNPITIGYADNSNNYAEANEIILADTTVPVEIDDISLPETFILGESSEISTSITCNGVAVTEGVVIFRVNGKTLRDDDGNVIFIPLDENGVTSTPINVTLEFLKEGTTIQAVYMGSNIYEPQLSQAIPVTVEKKIATVSLNDVTVAKGKSTEITVSVTCNDQPINSGRVALKVNGKTIKDETGNAVYINVKEGVAVIPYTVSERLKTNVYDLTAVFTDSYFDRSVAEAKLTVTE